MPPNENRTWMKPLSRLTRCSWISFPRSAARLRPGPCLPGKGSKHDLPVAQAASQKRNPRSLGGATRGGGTAEGGRRKLVFSRQLPRAGSSRQSGSVHVVHGQHANLAQLFVGEV